MLCFDILYGTVRYVRAYAIICPQEQSERWIVVDSATLSGFFSAIEVVHGVPLQTDVGMESARSIAGTQVGMDAAGCRLQAAGTQVRRRCRLSALCGGCGGLMPPMDSD